MSSSNCVEENYCHHCYFLFKIFHFILSLLHVKVTFVRNPVFYFPNIIVKVDFATLYKLQVVTSFRIQTGTSANTAIKGIEFARRGRCVTDKDRQLIHLFKILNKCLCQWNWKSIRWFHHPIIPKPSKIFEWSQVSLYDSVRFMGHLTATTVISLIFDQYATSPCNFKTLSNEQVTRKDKYMSWWVFLDGKLDALEFFSIKCRPSRREIF